MPFDPTTNQFQRNVFKTYYAKIKIAVEGVSQNRICAGDEFEYDGTILKYQGCEVAAPGVRGAVKHGWVTDRPLESVEDTFVAPRQNSRNVAQSQTINTDLSNVKRHAAGVLQSDSLDEQTVLNVSDRSEVRQANGRGHITQDHNRSGQARQAMAINRDALSEQEGTTIGRIRTPAKSVTDILAPSSHGLVKKLEELDGSGFIPLPSVEGISMGGTRSINRAASVHEDQDREVGRVRQVQDRGVRQQAADREAVEFDRRDDRRQAPEPAPAPRKASKPTKIDTKLDPKVRIARRIDPDFPSDWVFTGKLEARLAAVKEHGATPVFLEALYAAEGDQMRKKLEQSFPKQFALSSLR